MQFTTQARLLLCLSHCYNPNQIHNVCVHKHTTLRFQRQFHPSIPALPEKGVERFFPISNDSTGNVNSASRARYVVHQLRLWRTSSNTWLYHWTRSVLVPRIFSESVTQILTSFRLSCLLGLPTDIFQEVTTSCALSDETTSTWLQTLRYISIHLTISIIKHAVRIPAPRSSSTTEYLNILAPEFGI
jgi:hypothetical protein